MLMPMRVQFEEVASHLHLLKYLDSLQDVMPWLSLKPAFANWRLNLGLFRQRSSPNSPPHILSPHILFLLIMTGIQARTSEFSKGGHRAERRAKELSFQLDEDKKNQDRMTELATKLQAKIKTYKKQIEEAEEIAALNLAKFRKAQQELEETEERARLAEARISL